MKNILTRRLFWFLIAVVIALSATTAVLAKYIAELNGNSATFEAPNHYFRSNVMTEAADPTPIVINDTEATVTLSNGAGLDEFADVDVTYTLNYYAYISGTKTLVRTETDQTLAKDTLSTRTIVLTPLEVGGVTYYDVMLEAISAEPFVKSLRTRVQFVLTPHAITYTREGAVIRVTVATNHDSGSFTLAWVAGISPDSADENGILTGESIGPDSVAASLTAASTYQFKFFVTDEAILTALENGTTQPNELVTVSR